MRWYIPVITIFVTITIVIFILISQGIFSSNGGNNSNSTNLTDFASGRRSNDNMPKDNKDSVSIENLTNGINYLGLQITKDIHHESTLVGGSSEMSNQTQTIAFSPFNIAEALYLLLIGSADKTFDEIATVMKLNDPKFNIQYNSQKVHEQFGVLLQSLENFTETTLKLTTANGLFVQKEYPIGRKYKEIITNIYKSEVQSLDFVNNAAEAQNTINQWVSDKTNGKITGILVEPPPPNTKVILSTALYFKGAWEHPFSDSATHLRAFYPNGRENKNDSIMVDMMLNYGDFLYHHNKEQDCEIFSLPYKGDVVSMYIIVPKKSTKAKLSKLEKNFTDEVVQQLINELKITKAAIMMPKMKIESTTSLTSIFKHIGVQKLFDPIEANLNILSPGESDVPSSLSIDEIRHTMKAVPATSKLYVEEIIHKVYIDINESGTEAAATTDVLIPRSGGLRMLILDHPFMFFIRHNPTNVNLFYGYVDTPPASKDVTNST